MDISALIVPLAMAVAIIAFLFFNNRGKASGRNVCTRCSGSGEVDEKWPDPNEPSGWHRLEGKCPKCKGKGRTA